MDYLSKKEEETLSLGAKIAKTVIGGEIFALTGDLGTGKTTFVKGFARSLGIEKQITSPTFNIIKVYPVQFKNIKRLVHVDAYRLNSPEDLISIGLEELFSDSTNIAIIEWPEHIWGAIEKRAQIITFTFIDENTRKITFSTKWN